MRLITILILIAGTLSFSVAGPSAEVLVAKKARHPLIGKWQWTRPENKCTEIYNFKANGTAPVISGDEKTENIYSISPEPDEDGFYRLTMRVTKDFGGKDCSDTDVDSTGSESTTFILFEPSKNMYIDCVEPKPERCFGPLHRVEK